MAVYSVAEAKNSLPRLIKLVAEGESVQITRRGKPVAEIVALPHVKPRPTQAEKQAFYDRLERQLATQPMLNRTIVDVMDEMDDD